LVNQDAENDSFAIVSEDEDDDDDEQVFEL